MPKSTSSRINPPRPMNCFLLFRNDKQKEIVAKCKGANHRDISKVISKWWRESDEELKTYYRIRAIIEKEKHQQMYPNYKYSPKKK
ncbi:mating type protein MAT1-1, partial [Backusella circina FSU 941]